MGISDWSSDVCCSELPFRASIRQDLAADEAGRLLRTRSVVRDLSREMAMAAALEESERRFEQLFAKAPAGIALIAPAGAIQECNVALGRLIGRDPQALRSVSLRSEEHTSELQSLMRISYAVFCLKKQT